MTDRCVNIYRTVGNNWPLPVFFSETGIGSLFHVGEEYKGFVERGERLDLPDATWLEYQKNAFERDFYAFGVDKLFPFPDAFLKESQRMNADERKRQFDYIRSNPYLCGYSLTGLLDHGMCGEGLWSMWRKWKPEMFDAISDGWAPLRFSLMVTPESYCGDKIEIEAVLSNENVLRSGKYTADFGIENDCGTYYTFTEEFEVDDKVFVNPIVKRKLKLDLPEGSYRFTANLREGVPAATSTAFNATDKARLKRDAAPVYTFAVPDGAKTFIKDNICETLEFDDNVSQGTVIVGYAEPRDTAKLIAAARRGATVFFLDANMFYNGENIAAVNDIFHGIKLTKHYDWLYHKDYALVDRKIFNGTGARIAGLTSFGVTFPHHAFETASVPSMPMCPGVLTGYHGVEMSYAAMHGMLGETVGKGKVILSGFELLGCTDHPIAGKMLANIASFK